MSKPPNPLPIGQRVEIVRARKGIGRTALADALDLDRSTPAKWAAGDASPRDLEAVARVLGVEVSEIYEARPSKRGKAAA